ncbi:ATP-grasp domain-containing protein [Lutibacter sp. B1]|uniref:ATP-grasp domain-containing protein n=1 Tax=Lutibacter sp. B1 TaxID=2725996 RepID=UPI001456FF15|nr:ATP-grasp domain-containing protein [Lutibacter sp. B1]NLP56920.1 ATP-grasp domain-containing protein [Lutibacter sp. B1]
MILIDNPYVSDFLINTIKSNNLKIVATSEAKSLIPDPSLNWIDESEAINILKNKKNVSIYSNSENSINWVDENLGFTNLPNQIQLFKNKVKFRELIQELFPNYFFKSVKFNELKNIDIHQFQFPLIIKPAIGFFSIGVYKVESPTDWNIVLTKLYTEITELKNVYPKQVIDVSDFIIEEYIEGDEYAIDCYFNNKGEPVILNILHHVFSSGKDVSDRVYTTSKEIILKHKDNIQHFLNLLGKKADLTNFPIHIEIRINNQHKIYPIEVNPLRFGGWCTTADLTWYAYKFNSYEYFLNNKKPDWNHIFETQNNKLYSLIALNNNSGIKDSEIESFNFEKLWKDFENPLNLREFDFRKYDMFGMLFTETSYGNEAELTEILTSDLKKYINLKEHSNAL